MFCMLNVNAFGRPDHVKFLWFPNYPCKVFKIYHYAKIVTSHDAGQYFQNRKWLEFIFAIEITLTWKWLGTRVTKIAVCGWLESLNQRLATLHYALLIYTCCLWYNTGLNWNPQPLYPIYSQTHKPMICSSFLYVFQILCILCLASWTTLTSACILDKDTCYHTQLVCFLTCSKNNTGLMNKGCVLQRVFLGVIVVVLGNKYHLCNVYYSIKRMR